ncbi:hypothetical protein FBZ83_11977 [Azospirillum brasilense]|uniref:Uncharacterized protein n=2 Tax=Azospirillum brasilense TaxID=192 RepID=A0A560BUY9_AZOBR|nr:hypothetical protein FBZ83_11977 [Azospirillum brasilense]
MTADDTSGGDGAVRQQMARSTRAEAVELVIAAYDSLSEQRRITFHIAQAQDFTVLAELILKDPKARRRPTQLGHAAMVQDSARYHMERALGLAQDEITVLRELFRSTLDQLAQAQIAVGFYSRHAHQLEVLLREQTEVDVRDAMGRA